MSLRNKTRSASHTTQADRRRPGSKHESGSERSLRAELVETCRRLHARDLIGAGEGNVSVRLGADRFLVTPSGANKGYLSTADLVVVNGRGELVKGDGKASSELGMHLAAYSSRPDVRAVVHAHPLTAVAFTVAGLPAPNDIVPEAAVVLGEITIAPFATPGTHEVAASLAPLWAGHDVILLERHGALALGRTLAEAFDRLETLERAARIALVARLFGSCEPLPREAVDRVLVAAGRPGRTR